MASATKGTAHIHGIAGGVGVISNATVLSFNIDSEHANKLVTVNEIGNKIEDTRDDLTTTGTITLKIRSGYTVGAVFSNITYNSVTYQINKVGRAEQAGDFTIITYEIEKSEYITLS
jgi:hypothetical protein